MKPRVLFALVIAGNHRNCRVQEPLHEPSNNFGVYNGRPLCRLEGLPLNKYCDG